MNTDQRYPLHWPAGRPRTLSRRESPFRRSHGRGEWTLERLCADLDNEMKLLGVMTWVLSTNVELRRDGFPVSTGRRPSDPGAALYFRLKDKPIAFACDKWFTVEENVRAMILHIGAIRGTGRWGCGEVAQAFAGWAQLPAPADLRPWFLVLGVPEGCLLSEARDAYRRQAALHHPDNGGSHVEMAAINGAWARAQEILS